MRMVVVWVSNPLLSSSLSSYSPELASETINENIRPLPDPSVWLVATSRTATV